MNVQDLEQIYSAVKNNSKPIVIAVSGGSASGKTTQFSVKIKDLFLEKGVSCGILSQDSFQLGKTFVKQFEVREAKVEEEVFLHEGLKKYKWDTPENFDLGFCLEILEQIKAGIKEVRIPLFNLKDAQRQGETTFHVPDVIILEGIYAFFGQLSTFPFDYKIFVDSNFSGRILKRYFRFIYEHNNSKKETAIEHIFLSVLHAQIDFIESQKKDANLILKSKYCFKDTIEKFSLKPIIIEKWLNLEIEIEIIFEDIGRIRFARRDHKYIFMIVYGEGYFEYLEIRKFLYEQIVDNLKIRLYPFNK